ncbi:MAG: hypothetical protein ACR2QM_19245 [Longimicrobiales bacterium]
MAVMGFQNQRRVPFTVPMTSDESMEAMFAGDSSFGSAKATGLLGLEPGQLVIQFRPRPLRSKGPSWWSDFGRRLSGEAPLPQENAVPDSVSEIEIPLPDLASAHIKGWWNRVITLRTNNLVHWETIPGSSGDTIKLHVSRRDREAAEALVSALQMDLSDLGMRHLDRQIEALEREGTPKLRGGDGGKGD